MNWTGPLRHATSRHSTLDIPIPRIHEYYSLTNYCFLANPAFVAYAYPVLPEYRQLGDDSAAQPFLDWCTCHSLDNIQNKIIHICVLWMTIAYWTKWSHTPVSVFHTLDIKQIIKKNRTLAMAGWLFAVMIRGWLLAKMTSSLRARTEPDVFTSPRILTPFSDMYWICDGSDLIY